MSGFRMSPSASRSILRLAAENLFPCLSTAATTQTEVKIKKCTSTQCSCKTGCLFPSSKISHSPPRTAHITYSKMQTSSQELYKRHCGNSLTEVDGEVQNIAFRNNCWNALSVIDWWRIIVWEWTFTANRSAFGAKAWEMTLQPSSELSIRPVVL